MRYCMRGGSLNDPLSKYMFAYPTSNTYYTSISTT